MLRYTEKVEKDRPQRHRSHEEKPWCLPAFVAKKIRLQSHQEKLAKWKLTRREEKLGVSVPLWPFFIIP